MGGDRARGRRLAAATTAMTLVGWLATAAPAGAGNNVRGTDSRARALISRAEEICPTIVALLVALEPTDVVVMVQVTLMPTSVGGDLRMLGATGGYRYLIVRIDASRSPTQQMAFLGHELEHAREVSEATDVRDEASLARLMARIGRKTGNGTFETDGAVRVGRLVLREIHRAPF